MFARIKLIENNGGTTTATKPFWPLHAHSGGDSRFPTCGARQSVLKRFSKEDASFILSSSGDSNKTSTPVTYRAKLRRPSSWTSSDEVFSSQGTVASAETSSKFLVQSDSGLGATPTVVVDMGTKANTVGIAQVTDMGSIRQEENSVKVGSKADVSGDYSPSHLWNSDDEEARVRQEQLCTRCSR